MPMPPIHGDAPRPRVFVDADVLFAGAASPSAHSASLVVLQLAEITLIEAVISEQVLVEAERNLQLKLPAALTMFRLLVERCVRVVPAPAPVDLTPYLGLAEPKDLPVLVAALQASCAWLTTFNLRHYQPGHPALKVVRPGAFVSHLRDVLSRM